MYNLVMNKNPSLWQAINVAHVQAGTTTRIGGVSKPPYQSFNMAYHTGDLQEDVTHNRQQFATMINMPLNQMVFTYQSHSTILKRVGHLDAGKGSDRFDSGVNADALYTTDKGLLLGIFHADCVPVFIYHRQQPLIMIIHAGTPGSLQKITLLAVQQLIKETGVNASDLEAVLGPSLDFAHHPISESRVVELLAMDTSYRAIIKKIGTQYFLDIPLLNYLQLVDAGLTPQHIHVSNLDTYSNPEQYFSYDRDHQTGRHVSYIYLR